MKRHFALSLLALLGAGCAGNTSSPALTNDHPASVDAPSSRIHEMSNVLRQADPITPAAGSGGSDAGHRGMSHETNGMGGMQDGASNAPGAAASRPAPPPSGGVGLPNAPRSYLGQAVQMPQMRHETREG